MADFFKYLSEVFTELWRNLVEFLSLTFNDPWSRVPKHFDQYSQIFNSNKHNFGVGGWILFVLFIVLIVAIFAGFVYLIVIAIRHAVRARKNKVTKERLSQEIHKLNRELFFAVQEKNEILKLKAESLGIEEIDDGAKGQVAETFPRLWSVDEKYKDADRTVKMREIDEGITLSELATRFRDFSASQLGLFYDINLVRTLFAALGTTKVLILEGISGTGKTSLPYSLGKFFVNDVSICSVQPSWRDRTELIGYYNEFTKRFNESEFLRAVYEAGYREDPNIIILDEMNLARIEYYFAEFLSIMEMPRPEEWIVEVTKTPNEMNPKLLVDGKMLIHQNLWFFGTANNDDSTFTITDKVYDRAIAITLNERGALYDAEFTEPVRMPYEYLNKLFGEAKTNFPLSRQTLQKFQKLDEFVVAKFRIGFGNRIMRQIRTFVPIYVGAGGQELEALDFMFASKILKKFKSLNLAFMHEELRALGNEIDKLFGKNTFKQTHQLIDEYINFS
ncbi:MAG TPA: hypothetical protein VFD05_00085 [Bacilli bacterium]|nr:hypothetical protein [Bacilli bacterium]